MRENIFYESLILAQEMCIRDRGKNTGNKKPLVLLHGGPGSTHNYFEVLDRIAEEDGRQLVMYDQIGCGNSYVENRPCLLYTSRCV